MKLLKNSFLGTVFLLARGSATFAGTSSTIDSEAYRVPCGTMHTICHYANPSDFGDFDTCMIRNGCGG
ncbi:hypothetical protein [Psychroflexus sp. MES1-P1E]|uniref:hypothetical protein n=1 Tax=Psychroflexus sp. MES1-P1E TaxID=2058320 RepID=UPI000C7A23EE|nr:hypothetical protein [Psychroflexus sp. MES1-P1E]